MKPFLIVLSVVVTLAGVGALLRVFLLRSFRKGFDAGYRLGWDSMKAQHEEYRERNKRILAGLQMASALPARDDFPRPHSHEPPTNA